MMQVELEDAIGEEPVVTASGEPIGDKAISVGIIATLSSGLLGLIGWVIKKQMSGRRLEDAINDGAVDTLASARKRIRELEDQVRAGLDREIANSMAQIAASSAAQRAADRAEHASALAEAAQLNAVAARAEADSTQAMLRTAVAYYKQLRALMIAAGLTPPPEPEL